VYPASHHQVFKNIAAVDRGGSGSMKPELPMARRDYSDCSPLQRRGAESAPDVPMETPGVSSPLHDRVPDRVPWDCPGAQEIGFRVPERYNASEVLFQNLVAGQGERLAVIGPRGARSYAQLAADAQRWGNAFLALGLSLGDRIVLMLDDTPSYPAAFFGAVRAGLVPILINVLTPPDLLRFYLEDSGAQAAVVEAEFCDRFENFGGGRTPLRTLIVVNGESDAKQRGIAIKMVAEWVASFPDRLPCADTHRNDMAFWMYSSGSTGRPKGIVHLQHDMPYTHQSYARSVLKLRPDDICFSVPKIFFSYGFGNSITFPFSVGAASLLMPGRATPAAVFAAITQYRPTVFFGLPTLYTMLVHAPEVRDADFSSVRLAVSAAEILSLEIFNAWKQATGLEIVECLGSTEMLNVYLSNTPEHKKLGSAGMRVPGYEIVLKDDFGNEVPDGCEGTMWIRGQSGTPLFWNEPNRTAKTIGDGGWLYTGDRLVRDADGFYFFHGRKDDLVRVSGQWVNPIEVQRCLLEHAAVRECVVLPIELPDKRTTLKAFVVMNEPVRDARASTRALQDHVKQRLVPYKYPRLVQFLPALPKTGTGKIDRQALLSGAVNVQQAGPIASVRSRGAVAQSRRGKLAGSRQGGAA
jgi:benzoate-CoA ligase family protein